MNYWVSLLLDETTLTWSNAGELNTGRRVPGVIYTGSVLLVAGGCCFSQPKPTEMCIGGVFKFLVKGSYIDK